MSDNEKPGGSVFHSALSDAQQEIIVQVLRETFAPYAIILFGSAATGTLRKDSDLDLAYIADGATSNAYERFMVAGELADKLGREVDLIDFSGASPVFRSQVIGTGILLYDSDPLKRQELFMRSLKEYAMLNEERREILQKLLQGDES